MNNFFITVSNGLLTKEHRERIGTAIWEFMWCLDKITKVDDEGVGWVLGGKPIKLADVADSLGITEDTVSRNFHRLEDAGYLKLIHAPYGISIRVNKAKKRFYKNVGLGSTKMSNLPRKNVEPNKTYTVDNTVDIVGEAKKEFSFSEELEKLRLGGKNGDRKDFQIIALYWKKKNFVFENRKQFQAGLGRELRAAKSLTGYSGVQVGQSIKYCEENYKVWTLETVYKRIADLVNKK